MIMLSAVLEREGRIFGQPVAHLELLGRQRGDRVGEVGDAQVAIEVAGIARRERLPPRARVVGRRARQRAIYRRCARLFQPLLRVRCLHRHQSTGPSAR